MHIEIIKEIAKSLNIGVNQVEVVLKLLEEKNTIPFIARYRKEVTKGLDEEQIRAIEEVYSYQLNLAKRKEDVIRLIDEKGLLTPELLQEINQATKLVEVEDLYRPFKEKKKTKASEAIKLGLEPLAKEIMSNTNKTLVELATKYLTDQVTTTDFAITQASYIIAEIISDNAKYRKEIRNYIYYNGLLVTKEKKNHDDEKNTYKIYYEFKEFLKKIKPHQVMAINRAESEKVISVSISYDEEVVFNKLDDYLVTNKNTESAKVIQDAISDSLKRLIIPSVERELRSELTENGEKAAIDNFSNNVEKLLLTPPIKEKVVLGFDPAFRTGCKLAVLDKTGLPLDIAVIYPHEPVNKKEEAKKILLDLITKFKVDIIAIGNGTASRESEQFIVDVIKDSPHKVEYIIVSEAGASVYSASSLAISEFPDLTVEKRSAISIGRRLQDALSELVKIDPKSIGVGLYQHDVNTKKLDQSLTFVVEKVVNRVGVNINTASPAILGYISGLNKTAIEKIIAYRNQVGKIKNRGELIKKKVVTTKVYEQAIGFLRILDGENQLDKTDIHPESYQATLKLLELYNLTPNDLGSEKLNEILKDININDISQKLELDIYTITDIVASLRKPNRDLRDELDKPILKSDILEIGDLKIGDKVQGTVRNVVDFGVFIDIGLHNDGLAHISRLTNRFIKHPSEVLSVGDIVDCYITDLDIKREKVGLSLLSDK